MLCMFNKPDSFCFPLNILCLCRLQTSPVWAGPEARVAQRQAATSCLQRLQQSEPHHNSCCHALSCRAIQQQNRGKEEELHGGSCSPGSLSRMREMCLHEMHKFHTSCSQMHVMLSASLCKMENLFCLQCSHRRTLLEVVQKFVQSVKHSQSSKNGKCCLMLSQSRPTR